MLENSISDRLNYDFSRNDGGHLDELISFQLGIPYTKSSPLFKFNLNDYSDTNKVTKCVSSTLGIWATNYKLILDTISGKELPICGDVDKLKADAEGNNDLLYKQVHRYYPPQCGLTNAELEAKKESNKEYCGKLDGFLNVTAPPVRSFPFKSASVSYYYDLNEDKNNDFLWIPERFLP